LQLAQETALRLGRDIDEKKDPKHGISEASVQNSHVGCWEIRRLPNLSQQAKGHKQKKCQILEWDPGCVEGEDLLDWKTSFWEGMDGYVDDERDDTGRGVSVLRCKSDVIGTRRT
jgi:hypothetical protein